MDHIRREKTEVVFFLRLVGGCRNVEEEENVWGRFCGVSDS